MCDKVTELHSPGYPVPPTMSRHRLVKKINLDGRYFCAIGLSYLAHSTSDVLDDDALSDGGDEDMSQEDHGEWPFYTKYHPSNP